MKYKKLWLLALDEYEEHDNKATHLLRISNTYDAFGVLCDLHAKETGNKWESDKHIKVRSYMSNICLPHNDVLEWCEMSSELYDKLVILHTFDKIKEYLC